MKSKKNLKKIVYVFFDSHFRIKNYGEDLRHHCQILIELSRNAPYTMCIVVYYFVLFNLNYILYFNVY